MKASELSKKLPKNKKKSISELSQAIKNTPDQSQNFCLFLGAGASATSGIKTAGEMIREWRDIVCEDNDDVFNKTNEEKIEWLDENHSEWYSSSREYATLIEKIYPQAKQRQRLFEREVSDKVPSIGYAYLVRIAENGYIKTIFTTNFDDLINEAFYQFSVERPLVCAHDSSVSNISIVANRTKIVKLHGDYLYNDLKNTEDETRLLGQNMAEKLQEFLKQYGLIISGYSGNDKSITGNLSRLLESSDCLENGLYWIFRPNDIINSDVESILRTKGVYYVITDGFDETMADLYTKLCSNSTPFNSQIASNRATNIIETYIHNPKLTGSNSKAILSHIEELKSDKTNSLISEALNTINAEQISSTNLTDQDFLSILEIEKLIKSGDPSAALKLIDAELEGAKEKNFKEALLYRKYVCSERVFDINSAKDCLEKLTAFEPSNYYVTLKKCTLLEDREQRIHSLRKLIGENPYSARIYNSYANELRKQSKIGKSAKLTVFANEVEQAYQASISLSPGISNPAYHALTSLLINRSHSIKNADQKLKGILETHMRQNAYSSSTMSILYRYCKHLKTKEFNDKPIFSYLLEAYQKHFPKDYTSHIIVIKDACIEFKLFSALKEVLAEALSIDELKKEEEFQALLMDIHYDVFRDIETAIRIGELFIKNSDSMYIKDKLFDLYLDREDFTMAKERLDEFEGKVDVPTWITRKANYFERKGMYQDAIDLINSIPDKRDFDEKHCTHLSYLELCQGNHKRAMTRLKKFLNERSFNLHFQTELINYEYARSQETGKKSVKRLQEVADAARTPTIEGVALIVKGEKDEGIKKLEEECEKDFSNTKHFIRWPVLSSVKSEMQDIHDRLSKSQRKLEELEEA